MHRAARVIDGRSWQGTAKHNIHFNRPTYTRDPLHLPEAGKTAPEAHSHASVGILPPNMEPAILAEMWTLAQSNPRDTRRSGLGLGLGQRCTIPVLTNTHNFKTQILLKMRGRLGKSIRKEVYGEPSKKLSSIDARLWVQDIRQTRCPYTASKKRLSSKYTQTKCIGRFFEDRKHHVNITCRW